jgi:crotonobetainyl-CoA:carnitine CoA-transferase CaiB-like acyl-CoA transferase
MERCSTVPSVLGPYNLVDIGTGVLSAFATALAVFHRQRTGKGQCVFTSLAQTATYHQARYLLEFKGHVATEPRGYEALGTGALNRFYQGADAWFFLSLPELYRDRLSRVEGLDGIDAPSSGLETELEARFREQPASIWVERLTAAGVAAHAVTPLARLMTDAWAQKRGLSVSQVSEEAGAVTMPGVSVRLSRTPMRAGFPARQPGADAAAILEEAGILNQLPRLERAWAVQTTDLPSGWGAGGG